MTEEQQEIIKSAGIKKCCLTCINWTSCGELQRKGYADFSSGACSHNGYSKVPPMFVCPGWASGNGEIFDKTHNFD